MHVVRLLNSGENIKFMFETLVLLMFEMLVLVCNVIVLKKKHLVVVQNISEY